MSVLLLAAAGVQYNDPDPWLWMPIYGLASLLSVLFSRRRLPAAEAALFAVLLLALALWKYFTQVMGKASLLLTEPGNETLGLAVSGGWILILVAMSRRPRRARESA